MTVVIYIDTRKEIGEHPERIKVFANQDAAETWIEENDPERRCVRVRSAGMKGLGLARVSMPTKRDWAVAVAIGTGSVLVGLGLYWLAT